MKRLLLSLGLVLVSVAGCGDNEGESCVDDGDCDGSLICGQLAVCDEPGTCFGVCADPCESVDDCPSDYSCFIEPGGGRRFCRAE